MKDVVKTISVELPMKEVAELILKRMKDIMQESKFFNVDKVMFADGDKDTLLIQFTNTIKDKD